jgi:hypothetical protein
MKSPPAAPARIRPKLYMLYMHPYSITPCSNRSINSLISSVRELLFIYAQLLTKQSDQERMGHRCRHHQPVYCYCHFVHYLLRPFTISNFAVVVDTIVDAIVAVVDGGDFVLPSALFVLFVFVAICRQRYIVIAASVFDPL